MRGLVMVSVLCLAAGAGLIFGYCNGTTGLQFGYPLSVSSLRVDMTTKGWPALTGVTLAAVGAFLLFLAFFAAISGMIWRRDETLRRRDAPFRDEPFES